MEIAMFQPVRPTLLARRPRVMSPGMYPVSRHVQRLELREFTTADADEVFAIYGSREATEHLSFEPRSRDEVGRILHRSIASATAESRTEYALAVIERDGGELIGFARLATDPHQQRAATLGFVLRPDRWGPATASRPSDSSSASDSTTRTSTAFGAYAHRSTPPPPKPCWPPECRRSRRSANTSRRTACGATLSYMQSSNANGRALCLKTFPNTKDSSRD
ncbi:GNAT family N-acetyltransferase [Streptomyces niveus]|uniref:GNAT family N-acetyltransferase n=1 Tax=Streptomyces niveus TaxID=193462 RepID=UPI0034088377